MATTTEASTRLADLHDEDFAARARARVDALRALAASGAALPGLDLPRWLAKCIIPDGIDPGELPEACPYTLERIEDPDGWPRNRHGLAKP